MVEFITQSTLLVSSSTMMAVLMVLACLMSAACASSIGDVCRQDPRPHDETIWNDNPTDVNVTVEWSVEEVIILSKTDIVF